MGWLAGWLIETTWQVAILVAAIAVVQMVLGRWLSPRARYAMWMIVLVRLAMPVLPASTWSVYGFLGHRPAVPPQPAAVQSGQPAKWAISALVVDQGKATSAGARTEARVLPRPTVVSAETLSETVNWRMMGLCVWAGGAGVMLARVGVQSIRSMRLRRRASGLTTAQLPLGRALRERLKRTPVMESAQVTSPALCGLLRPAILLPAGLSQALDGAQLEHVIRHELAHLGRLDHVTNAALRLLQAIHWFNPAVWYVSSRCRLERELACDEAVLRRSEATERELYGRTLLAMATQMTGTGRREPMLAMAEGKRHLVRRIRGIANDGGRRRSRMLAGMICTVLVFCGLTVAQTQPAEPARRVPVKAAPATTQNVAGTDQAIEQVLDKRVDITWVDHEPLDRALEKVADLGPVNMVVDWPALEAAGVKRDALVLGAGRLRSMRLSQAIRVVLSMVPNGDEARLRSYLSDGVVTITTERAMASSHLSTQVYDVTDLDLGSHDTSGSSGVPANVVDDVEQMIKTTVRVGSWKDNGGWGTIRKSPAGKQLVITQGPEEHQAIAALLAQVRETLELQVSVECRFICLDPSKLSPRIQAAFKGNEGTYLDEEGLAELDKAVRAVPQQWMANAPRVTVFNGGTAKAQALSHTAYVSGYKGSTDASGKAVYSPVSSQTEEGVTITVRANISADRKFVTLSLMPQLVELVGMATELWEGSKAAGQNLVVQRPDLQTRKIETLVSVPDRGAVVLGGLTSPGAATQAAGRPAGAERVYVVVRPAIVNVRGATTRPAQPGGKPLAAAR